MQRSLNDRCSWLSIRALVLRGACDVSFPGLRQHRRNDAFRPDDERRALGGVSELRPIESVELEIVSDRLGIGGAKLGSFDLFARAPLPNTLGQIDTSWSV